MTQQAVAAAPGAVMTVTVVTGAGSGIGRATALRFARRGSTVLVADIDERSGVDTVGDIRAVGGRAEFHQLDVSDADAWERFAERVCRDHGLPRVVVNNAGILISGGFLEQSGADWRRMIGVNMMGPLLGSRVFVQRMVDAGVRGNIVNICSVGAFLPTPLGPSYATAKAGAWMGTQALRAEFAYKGIGISAVCPIDRHLAVGQRDPGRSGRGCRGRLGGETRSRATTAGPLPRTGRRRGRTRGALEPGHGAGRDRSLGGLVRVATLTGPDAGGVRAGHHTARGTGCRTV